MCMYALSCDVTGVDFSSDETDIARSVKPSVVVLRYKRSTSSLLLQTNDWIK